MRAEIDFKEKYKSGVRNVKLLIDIPESCSFVGEPVMIGNTVSGGYTISGNQVTVPTDNYSDVVRFCVISIGDGDFAPNAFVEFELDGDIIRQPIGVAPFSVKGMELVVPDITAQKTIPVRGTAIPKSVIKVYDNGVLTGQTTVLANGSWRLIVDLYQPDALSYHNIHAEALTPQGVTVLSDVKRVTYNISAIEVSKVTMINTAHPATSTDLCEYVTVFDFIHPVEKCGVYQYFPDYQEFTFLIEFTENTPDFSDVDLYVFTSSGSVVILPAVYDPAKKEWIAKGEFDAYNLPLNVNVDFDNLIMKIPSETLSSSNEISSRSTNMVKTSSANGEKYITLKHYYDLTWLC